METFNLTQLHGIARLLVQETVLSHDDATHYQRIAIEKKMNLQHYLVTHHIVSAHAIAFACARHFNLPFVDLSLIDPSTLPLSLFKVSKRYSHLFIPLSIQGKQLSIATDDPCNQTLIKEIQFNTGYQVTLMIVETDKLQQLLAQLSHRKNSQDLDECLQHIQILGQFETQINRSKQDPNDDAPIVKLVNQILLEAIKKDASDIHFEPYDNTYRIRYRQYGLLMLMANPPISFSTRIAARIKIMAQLDISEKRLPQDGRFHSTSFDNKLLHFRVSTCPTVSGEKIVIRILDPNSAKPNFDTLGLSHHQQQLVLNAIERSQGMILVTGPTGSGKTMTLYSALAFLNTLDKNICAVEDPVELQVAGVNQVNVHLKAGLNFSTVLRSFLRQDPDIIMVGEMRDLDTADIAIKAALTGHLVLSTLHTNSAAETLTRLIDMGIAVFNIAHSVTLIIAQRLIRLLCEHCKVRRKDLEVSQGINYPVYKASGCVHCTKGYRGRMGLFEVLPISKNIAQLILNGKNADTLLKQAQIEGMQTLYQMGLKQVKRGITTIEEINRVTVE